MDQWAFVAECISRLHGPFQETNGRITRMKKCPALGTGRTVGTGDFRVDRGGEWLVSGW